MKKAIKLSVIVTVLLSVIFSFSACVGSNYHSGFRRLVVQADRVPASPLVRSGSVMSLPESATDVVFLGDDLAAVAVSGGSFSPVTVFDLIANRSLVSGVVSAFTVGNYRTGLFIVTENADNERALRSRAGTILIPYNNDISAGDWSNIDVLSSNILRIGNDIWRVSGNTAIRIIENTGDVSVAGRIIVEHVWNWNWNWNTYVIYNLNGDVLYVSRTDLGQFMILSERRGVYVNNIRMPRDTRSRDWDFSYMGRKFKQVVYLVDFRDGNRSRTNVSGALFSAQWLAFMAYEYDEDLRFMRDDAYDRVLGALGIIKNDVLIPDRAEMVIFNDSLSVRHRLGEDVKIPLARNRYFVSRMDSHTLGMITNRSGDILRVFDGTVDLDEPTCIEAGLIRTLNDNYYDFNGRRVITRNDYNTVSRFFGGYAIASREIIREAADGVTQYGTGWYSINNRGVGTRQAENFAAGGSGDAVSVDIRANAGIYIVSFMRDGEQVRRIYNFAGTFVHAPEQGSITSVMGGREVSGAGSAYVVLSLTGGGISVVRLAA